MTEVFDGGCLCGAVRFRATGRPKWVLWCHCQSCRKHSGAPASVFVAFETTAIASLAGEIAQYASSPGVVRGFCRGCGSTLSCSNAGWPGEIHLHVGAFDQAVRLAPHGEIFPDERLAWFPSPTPPPEAGATDTP